MDMETYLDITGDAFSEMRVLAEGALSLIDDHAGTLNHLASEAGIEEARTALNDVCGALYTIRKHIRELQAAHLKHLSDSTEVNKSAKLEK